MSPPKRVPHLAHWGAFDAVVQDGVLLRCEPFAGDPDPSPITDGIVSAVYSPNRIRRPCVRRGWLERREHSDGSARGSDDFVEVDWDVALDLVAHELRRVRETHGADGILGGSYGWSSAGRLHHARSLIRRFHFTGGGCVDQIGNYSWGAAQFMLPQVIGTHQSLTGLVTDWPSIIRHTDLFVAFGGLALKNGQITSGGAGRHTLKHWLEQLAASGAHVISVSPVRSDCPAFLNAEWVPIRPNTDAAFMLALAHEIVRNGGQDESFLASHCVGWPVLRAYVLGESDGVPKSARWAQDITGVPAERIADVARRLCGVRSYLTASYSVQRAHRGEQPYWMLIALAAMLGHVGAPGGGFGFGHGSMNGVGNPRIQTPGPEMPVPANPARSSIPVARIADMLLHPGEPYRFQGETRTYPDIRLIHWAGGNPFHHHQQLNRLVRAWARPETIVVHDIWWTPTAKRADIVLPATTTLERNDIGGSSRDPYVFAMRQAIEPLHMARCDLSVLTELSQRLGTAVAFTENRTEQAWLRCIYDRFRDGQGAAGANLPDFEAFWHQGRATVPPRTGSDFVLLEDFRADPSTHPLATPSGRIELFSQAILAAGEAGIKGHPQWIEPAEWLGSPRARRYPIHLVSVQPANRLHSQSEFTPPTLSSTIAGSECVTLHPDDARARSLEEGTLVRIRNDRGACLAGLKISADVLRGVAIIATGAWFAPDASGLDRAGAANTLTLDIGTSEWTQGPNAMSCLVEIEAIDSSPRAVAGGN